MKKQIECNNYSMEIFVNVNTYNLLLTTHNYLLTTNY